MWCSSFEENFQNSAQKPETLKRDNVSIGRSRRNYDQIRIKAKLRNSFRLLVGKVCSRRKRTFNDEEEKRVRWWWLEKSFTDLEAAEILPYFQIFAESASPRVVIKFNRFSARSWLVEASKCANENECCWRYPKSK